MHRLSSVFVFSLLAVSPLAITPAAAADYLLEVQWGGPGTVSPSDPVVVPAGGSQTFTFTPSGCNVVGEVTVDDVPVGTGITSYTFTNVQSDHVLYVPFGLPGTTTTLTVRPVSGACALPETLTATVASAENGAPVRFFRDGTLLATRFTTGGVASYIVSPGFPTGSYGLSASYLGTSCSGASDSPVVPYDVADTGPGTTVTLALAESTVVIGDSEYATAHLYVGSVVGGSGQVTFYDGGAVLGSAAMANGTASFSWYPQNTGIRLITAVVHVNTCASDVASEPETLHVVPSGGGATHTTLAIDPEQVDVGGSVVMTATVSPAAASGLVHFLDITNSVEIGTASLASGVATLNYGPVSGSNRNIEAYYGGDGVYVASTSSPVLLGVGPRTATVLVLTASSPGIYSTSSVTFTARLAPSGITGAIHFVDVERGIAWNAGLNSDNAVTTLSQLGPGVHHVIASFAGNVHYLPSADTVAVTVIAPYQVFPDTYESYVTEFGPRSIAIADLNADGGLDLVTANQGATSVSVLRGRGDGTFEDHVEYGDMSQPNSVAVTDLNGDGTPDLVVVSAGGLSALLGNGDGTFQPNIDYGPVRPGPNGLAVADFNGDGRYDVAVTCHDYGFSVLLGHGDGTFQAQLDHSSSPTTAVAAGDLNGDGRADLVVMDTPLYTCPAPPCGHPPDPYGFTGEASVYLGNGDGTFGSPHAYNTGTVPVMVALGDLNGDGYLDIVAPAYGYQGGGRRVSVLLGNGDGSFAPDAEYGDVSAPRAVAIADFDRDGWPDIAVSGGASHVFVLHGLGDGQFAPQSQYNSGYEASMFALATADLNRDVAPDLVVAGTGGSGVSVLLNKGHRSTAVEFTRFEATAGPDGIEVRWSFADDSRVSAITIQRAATSAGPWNAIAATLRHDAEGTIALDRTADPGRTYFYRLDVALVDGSHATIGPIASIAGGYIAGSALRLLAPNPTHDATTVEYAVARAGHVRLEVADVAGRVVTTLVDGMQQSGRFTVAWDGTSRGEQLPAGLYFVRLMTPDRVVTRKLTRIP